MDVRKKVIRIIEDSDEIDTFEISMVLMEPVETVNSIVEELEYEGIVNIID
jgi:hypothetical protein